MSKCQPVWRLQPVNLDRDTSPSAKVKTTLAGWFEGSIEMLMVKDCPIKLKVNAMVVEEVLKDVAILVNLIQLVNMLKEQGFHQQTPLCMSLFG